MMRVLLVAGCVCLPSLAFAYDGFSPLSGPNTAIPSPVCDVINFGFCPQPPSPPVPGLPDPDEVAARRVVLPPPAAPRHIRHGRVHHHHAVPPAPVD